MNKKTPEIVAEHQWESGATSHTHVVDANHDERTVDLVWVIQGQEWRTQEYYRFHLDPPNTVPFLGTRAFEFKNGEWRDTETGECVGHGEHPPEGVF